MNYCKYCEDGICKAIDENNDKPYNDECVGETICDLYTDKNKKSSKLYIVRWSFHGADSEWHSGNCYSNAGIFTSKADALNLEHIISSIKTEFDERRFDVYIEEIDEGIVIDNFIKNQIEKLNKQEK